jgi:hypothetical protein
MRERLAGMGEGRHLVGRPASLLLDKAPTHNNRAAMQNIREHNAGVILFPLGLLRVLEPVDMGCARPFKGKLSEAGQRLDKPCWAEAALQELEGDISRASLTRYERV